MFIGVICNWMCATHYLFVNKDSVKKRFTEDNASLLTLQSQLCLVCVWRR